MHWEIGIDINTLLCIKQKINENRLYSTGNSGLHGDLWGRDARKEGTCVHVIDSLCCTEKTNKSS